MKYRQLQCKYSCSLIKNTLHGRRIQDHISRILFLINYSFVLKWVLVLRCARTLQMQIANSQLLARLPLKNKIFCRENCGMWMLLEHSFEFSIRYFIIFLALMSWWVCIHKNMVLRGWCIFIFLTFKEAPCSSIKSRCNIRKEVNFQDNHLHKEDKG